MAAEGAIVVPALGESIVEATVLRWLRKEGDEIAAGDPVVELETDKVNVEAYADQAGVLSTILKQEGETVGIGEKLAEVTEDGRRGAGVDGATPATAPKAEHRTPNTESNGVPAATPVAQRMAAEKQLDLSRVKGTGPGGKVTKEDVANYTERTADAPRTAQQMAEKAKPAATPVAPTPPRPPAPAPAGIVGAIAETLSQRGEERVRITRLRQTIMERLKQAQNTAAMLTTFNEIDMTAVMEVRKRRRDTFKERYGVSLGFMSFFTKAAIGALKAFPYLNAEIREEEIVLKHYYDIGIAVSTDRGLVVPVLRDADRQTFAKIEQGIAELATRARENKLTLPELTGGTFTLTNGGVFGSLLSTPILNYPQVGILGLHKIEERPVAKDGQVVIRPMMYVALSYDHRIVDGSDAVRFLVKVKELIEDPESLLLEG